MRFTNLICLYLVPYQSITILLLKSILTKNDLQAAESLDLRVFLEQISLLWELWQFCNRCAWRIFARANLSFQKNKPKPKEIGIPIRERGRERYFNGRLFMFVITGAIVRAVSNYMSLHSCP